MIYKIKDDELILYDEDLFGRKENRIMSVKLEHLALVQFSKAEVVEIKTLLVKKDLIEAASKLTVGA